MAKIIETEVVSCLVDTRLCFENDRLYITKIPCEDGIQVDFSEKIDVTEEVLDAFLRIMCKRSNESYQRCMIEQIKNGY